METVIHSIRMHGINIDKFVQLGQRLEGFGRDDTSAAVIREAIAANPWFSERDIVTAIESLRNSMLSRDILERWLEAYPDTGTADSPADPPDIAVIMAGNIPAVGFFDMMCVLICGYNCYVKPSSKDTVLIRYLVKLLRNADPGVGIFDYDDSRGYDAVIATGSDNSNRYFRARFAGIRALLRGNRSSLAVLSGDEMEDELKALSDDIFLYNGMGCRNVSLIFLPRGYDVGCLCYAVAPERHTLNPKYLNNYRQGGALMSLMGGSFLDGGSFMMCEARDFPDAPSRINYSFYDAPSEIAEWIALHESRIQCVVSKDGGFLRGTVFGRAQYPRPWDYPDGVDVIQFLTGLQ